MVGPKRSASLSGLSIDSAAQNEDFGVGRGADECGLELDLNAAAKVRHELLRRSHDGNDGPAISDAHNAADVVLGAFDGVSRKCVAKPAACRSDGKPS